MDPISELADWARDLLANARIARLGLLDDAGAPRVLPITFALHDGRLWTAVDRKPKRRSEREPARVRYLRRRREVAFTADHYSDDWDRLAWVQVLGRASLCDPTKAIEPMKALAGKYEPYRSEPPPGPLIAITPERALSWRASAQTPGSAV